MKIRDPEQAIARRQERRISYPGLQTRSGIYGYLCELLRTQSRGRTAFAAILAYVKARYSEGSIIQIENILRLNIYTILACVEYPDVRRDTAATRTLNYHVRRSGLDLSQMTLEERCASMVTAIYTILQTMTDAGAAYGFLAQMRSRISYYYVRECLRDAGQQNFARCTSFQLESEHDTFML